MLDILERIDHSLFFIINNGWSCGPLDDVFIGLSELGAWTIAIVALALLAGQGRPILRRHVLVVSVFLIAGSVMSSVIKNSVKRPRPLKEFSEQIAAGSVQVKVLEARGLHRNSFPSGHTMLAFFLMTYAGQSRRSSRPYALLLAFGVALARVYVGAHFPLDCAAGAILGAAWGYAAWRAFEWSRKRWTPGA